MHVLSGIAWVFTTYLNVFSKRSKNNNRGLSNTTVKNTMQQTGFIYIITSNKFEFMH